MFLLVIYVIEVRFKKTTIFSSGLGFTLVLFLTGLIMMYLLVTGIREKKTGLPGGFGIPRDNAPTFYRIMLFIKFIFGIYFLAWALVRILMFL